ncbi:tripartite tricarboxylate transporter substrate-binding protein [Tepidimonas taiwanensis]|uniref:Bug family tripartite tricarboxylate transporter substrate binding protein n=1 Tax=Tepidimonas taiwanensis TaxID=307486 RepID=UPI0009E73439
MIDRQRRLLLCTPLLTMLGAGAARSQPAEAQCIVPAQPGGGFDLTCRLAQSALTDGGLLPTPLRMVHMPGGVGAVAYHHIVNQRPADGNVIVAFSGGSLLNLALGKFGNHSVRDVRWLASVGTDYGAVMVRADAPYATLKALITALKEDPNKIVIGGGGSVGSQDWFKAALTARAAGIPTARIRYLGFEGGGAAMTALQNGHIQVVMGDASEAIQFLEKNTPVRILAVYSQQRLPGRLANTPTALEQGFDIDWPVIRGFYMGPKVSETDYQWWVAAFKKAMSAPGFAALQQQRGLFPLDLVGPELERFVKERTRAYAQLVKEFVLAH